MGESPKVLPSNDRKGGVKKKKTEKYYTINFAGIHQMAGKSWKRISSSQDL